MEFHMERNQESGDRQIIRTFLKNNGGTAAFSKIEEVCSVTSGRRFGPQRIRRAVKWDQDHPSERSELRILPGGRSCRLVENSERVGIGRGAKAEAVRAVAGGSKAIRGVFTHGDVIGTNAFAYEVGKARGPVTGAKSRPDILVGVMMSERARRPILHNIEFQGKNPTGKSTFDISDIAQAFVSGRGADYSWVLITSEVRKYKTDQHYEDWERAVWLAKTLGVGIISYKDPRLANSWKVAVPSEIRRGERSTPEYRALYLSWWTDFREGRA